MAKHAGFETRDWNDNSNFLERLDNRFNECDEAANSGFIITWYRSLKTMYRKMHNKIIVDKDKYKLKEGDINYNDHLNSLFEKCRNKLQEMNQSYGNKLLTQQFQSYSITDAEQVLDEIDMILSDLYVKYYIRLEGLSADPNEAIKEVFR